MPDVLSTTDQAKADTEDQISSASIIGHRDDSACAPRRRPSETKKCPADARIPVSLSLRQRQ